MKWSQFGRITMAFVASLALGLSITACNQSFTLGYVYVVTAKSNQINAYAMDSVSGALTALTTSPFPSGGVFPIASVTDNRSKWLYVAHEVDNSIVQFGIGSGGALQSLHTYNTPGTFPISVTIDPQSRYLFVVDTFAPAFNAQVAAGLTSGAITPPGTNPLTPAAASFPTYGCVVAYPISATDGSLGTAVADPVSGQNCFPLNGSTAVQGSQPIGVTATGFVNFLYVADQGTHTVYPFSVNYANGILTPLATLSAGVKPSAIASDPSGRFVYVTDQYSNQLLAYNVQASGTLLPQLNGPFATDLFPNAITIDPRGLFLYVTNFNSHDVRAYAIDQATGNPTGVSGGLSYPTGTGPTCIVIEPTYGRFVFVSNFLDNTVSSYELNPHTGVLSLGLNSPFATSGEPTCVATAAGGTHPIQSITP